MCEVCEMRAYKKKLKKNKIIRKKSLLNNH